MKKILSVLLMSIILAFSLGNSGEGCNTFAKTLNYRLHTSTNTYEVVNSGNLTDSTVTIPKTYGTSGYRVTQIRTGAFRDSATIKELIIQDGGVTHIGGEAFDNCVNLEKVTLGDSVVSISARAFRNCPKLKTVVLNNVLTEISYEAFMNCSNLEKIFLPDTITVMGHDVFKGCSKLTIYAAFDSQPNGWTNFNPDNRPVVWGYKGN